MVNGIKGRLTEILQHGADGDALLSDLSIDGEEFSIRTLQLDERHVCVSYVNGEISNGRRSALNANFFECNLENYK